VIVIVIAGPLQSSVTRQSINCTKKMDARVKPAHDGRVPCIASGAAFSISLFGSAWNP